MQCNHRLQTNLHYPTFLSPLSPQFCFRRAHVSVQRQTGQPHFLAMYTWIFAWTLTPLTLVFQCWPACSGHIPGLRTFDTHVIYRIPKRSFISNLFLGISINFYCLLPSRISNANRLWYKLPITKDKKQTLVKQRRKTGEQWQRKNLLN